LLQSEHSNWIRHSVLPISLLLSLSAQAELITDGTVGTARPLSGQNRAVSQNLGIPHGSSPFHSFRTLGTPTGGSVTFTRQLGIDNVISRVTGGDVPHINGALLSRVKTAQGSFNTFSIGREESPVVLSEGAYTADAPVDVDSDININTLVSDISSLPTPLVVDMVDTTGPAYDACAAGGALSSFRALGREGLPASADQISSPPLSGELLDELLNTIEPDA